jgi:hypothetical protein
LSCAFTSFPNSLSLNLTQRSRILVQFLPVRWTNSKRQFSFEVAASSSPYTFATS